MKTKLIAIVWVSLSAVMLLAVSCQKQEFIPNTDVVKPEATHILLEAGTHHPNSLLKQSKPGVGADTIKLFELPEGVILEQEGRDKIHDILTEPYIPSDKWEL